MQEEDSLNVAVVGGGIHGSSIALSLARRGHSVTVFDPLPLNHRDGSSHGRSRIIRTAYPDPFYAEIMRDAYPMWAAIQSEIREPVVFSTGILYFGPNDSPDLHDVEQALQAIGSPFRDTELGLDEPFLFNGERAILAEDGGWVNADAIVAGTWSLAMSHGATFVANRIVDPNSLLSQFDRVILATGASIRAFIDLPIQVRVQTVAYVKKEWTGPVWIEDGPDFLYGFPSEPGESTIKIGVHNRGIDWDLQSPRPELDQKSLDLIADFVKRRFGIDQPEFAEIATCLYTMTPDEDFRWGWLTSKIAYVSACSGHGFKFGPWIGERMADAMEAKFDLSSIDRFHVGSPHRSS